MRRTYVMQPYLDSPSTFLDECMSAAFQPFQGVHWNRSSTSQSEAGDADSYAYSYSSTTNYAPETGTVSQTAKHYRDSSGVTKKVVERQLDDTVVTETTTTDGEGKKQISHTVGQGENMGKVQRPIERKQLEEFEEEWIKRSDKVNTEPSTFVYVNLQPRPQLPLLGTKQEGKKREGAKKRESKDKGIQKRESKDKGIQSEVYHMGITCDGCEMTPIKGLRFQSTKVQDFDLCENCEEIGNFEDSHGPFLKIKKPPHQRKKADVLHSGVFCNGCGMSPIRGIRYHSSKNNEFDLCSTCEEKGYWEESNGPFIKLKRPSLP